MDVSASRAAQNNGQQSALVPKVSTTYGENLRAVLSAVDALGNHIFKLALLVITVFLCAALWILVCVWLVLFWLQTHLFLITAALLESCMESEEPRKLVEAMPDGSLITRSDIATRVARVRGLTRAGHASPSLEQSNVENTTQTKTSDVSRSDKETPSSNVHEQPRQSRGNRNGKNKNRKPQPKPVSRDQNQQSFTGFFGKTKPAKSSQQSQAAARERNVKSATQFHKPGFSTGQTAAKSSTSTFAQPKPMHSLTPSQPPMLHARAHVTIPTVPAQQTPAVQSSDGPLTSLCSASRGTGAVPPHRRKRVQEQADSHEESKANTAASHSLSAPATIKKSDVSHDAEQKTNELASPGIGKSEQKTPDAPEDQEVQQKWGVYMNNGKDQLQNNLLETYWDHLPGAGKTSPQQKSNISLYHGDGQHNLATGKIDSNETAQGIDCDSKSESSDLLDFNSLRSNHDARETLSGERSSKTGDTPKEGMKTSGFETDVGAATTDPQSGLHTVDADIPKSVREAINGEAIANVSSDDSSKHARESLEADPHMPSIAASTRSEEASPNPAFPTQLFDEKLRRTLRRSVRETVKQAWGRREQARVKALSENSLESALELEKATERYNQRRQNLISLMQGGQLYEYERELWPHLANTDLTAPKHRPQGIPETLLENKLTETDSRRWTEGPDTVPNESTSQAIVDDATEECNDKREGFAPDTVLSKVDPNLKATMDSASTLLQQARDYRRNSQPQGNMSFQTWDEKSAAQLNRAIEYYNKKRDALEAALGGDSPELESLYPRALDKTIGHCGSWHAE